MSNTEEWWDRHVRQLQKYDDDLIGWWTDDERLGDDSNTILLVSLEKSVKFRKHVEEAIRDGVSFKKPIAFVGFMQTGTPEESVLFQLDWGKINNRQLNDALEDRKLIPLERFVASLGPLKFYDSPPPVEYMMEVLWNQLFNDLKISVKMDERTKTWPISISIPGITSDLQRLYGQVHDPRDLREVSFPNIAWVREAIEHFEVLGLAKREDLDNYTILFKNLRGDLLERFSKARKLMKKKLEKRKQLELKLDGPRRLLPTESDAPSTR
jgi:hypothetical protein